MKTLWFNKSYLLVLLLSIGNVVYGVDTTDLRPVKKGEPLFDVPNQGYLESEFQRMRERIMQMDQLFDDRSFAPGFVNNDNDVLISEREDDKYKYIDIESKNMNPETMKINIKDGMISISGEIKKISENEIDGRKSYSEFISTFQRSFNIPDGVDQSKADFEKNSKKVTIKFPKI